MSQPSYGVRHAPQLANQRQHESLHAGIRLYEFLGKHLFGPEAPRMMHDITSIGRCLARNCKIRLYEVKELSTKSLPRRKAYAGQIHCQHQVLRTRNQLAVRKLTVTCRGMEPYAYGVIIGKSGRKEPYVGRMQHGRKQHRCLTSENHSYCFVPCGKETLSSDEQNSERPSCYC